MKRCMVLISVALGILVSSAATPIEKQTQTPFTPSGWQAESPREEIRPEFAFEAEGGISGKESLIIRTDARQGLDGCWRKSFPVAGGKPYRVSAFYKSKM